MSAADLPVGTRVRLAAYGARTNDTAVVTAVGPCEERGCREMALTVRRDPGCFVSWYADTGTWHLSQCERVGAEHIIQRVFGKLIADLRALDLDGDEAADRDREVRAFRTFLDATREERTEMVAFLRLPEAERQERLRQLAEKEAHSHQ